MFYDRKPQVKRKESWTGINKGRDTSGFIRRSERKRIPFNSKLFYVKRVAKLIVVNLPQHLSHSDLQQLYGGINGLNFINFYNDNNGQFQGVAVLVFELLQDALSAITFHGNIDFGQTICLKIIQEFDVRPKPFDSVPNDSEEIEIFTESSSLELLEVNKITEMFYEDILKQEGVEFVSMDDWCSELQNLTI